MAGTGMLEALDRQARSAGLSLRGVFHPETSDGVPAMASGEPVVTLVLLGWMGGRQWPFFAASPEIGDGAPDPLDRWSRRTVGDLARSFGAQAFYPFGGAPYLPFQKWARKCDAVFPSPLGLFVHAEHGLWHSYRGALGFSQFLDLPKPANAASPCETCIDAPCLSACPVMAFTPGHYDVAACAAHVRSPEGALCRSAGCLARRACWVAPEMAYGGEEVGFYMKAFLAAR